MSTGMRPGRFSIDGIDCVFEGLWDGTRWNGWAVPHFDLATTARILGAVAGMSVSQDPDNPTRFEYDPETPGFLLHSSDGTDESFEPDEGGLYSFLGWCWWAEEDLPSGPTLRSVPKGDEG